MENIDNNKLIESNPPPENNDEIPFKEDEAKINEKPGAITVNKTKPSSLDSDIERKRRIKMYIVFSVFLLLCLLCLIVEDNFFLENFENLITTNNNKDITFILLFISIFGAIGLSIFISYCECLIKTHFLGVLFLIVLYTLNNYSIIYLKHIQLDFPMFFCPLMALVGGSLGLLLISFIVKEGAINILFLYGANALFSVIFGAIACYFYDTFWPISFCITAILLSEFNIYSSQYKFIVYKEETEKKRVKKEPLMYIQPFELNISVIKIMVLLASLLIKLFKLCIKCCTKKDGNNGNNPQN